MHGEHCTTGFTLRWRSRLILWSAAIVAAMLFAPAAFASSRENNQQFRGPFLLDDGITFFVVNPTGKAFSAEFRWRDRWREHQPRPFLIRAFDPDDRLVVRHEFEGERVPTRNVPWENVTLEIPGGLPGVYQIIAYGFAPAELDIALTPQLSFGVMGHPEWLASRAGQIQEAYFHVPPGLDRLHVRTRADVRNIVIEDEHGAALLNLRGTNASGSIAVTERAGRIWRIKVETTGEYRLNFDWAPVILCPDPATARAIAGGVTVLEDGVICFHRFQEKAWRLLEKYRQLPARAFDVPVPRLMDYADAWIREPQRNVLLLGAAGVFSTLPAVLYEQNLDPKSPWFGSINVWRDVTSERKPRPQNPHATYDRLDSIFRAEERVGGPVSVDRAGGGIHMGREVAQFAVLYTLDDPINPLYRHPALLNRIIIGALQDLMMIHKHELQMARPTSFSGGMRAFSLERQLETYSIIAPHLPDDVRELLTEGLRRFVDRSLIGVPGGTVNQWAAIPVGIYAYYMGSRDSYYRDWAMKHVQWMATGVHWGHGQKPAGYLTESDGPDSTYTGITTTLLAWLYHRTGDEQVLEIIRRAFYLFNHTIAPDPFNPGGIGVGATDFCHRTAGDWWSPQGKNGGLIAMADILPEAGLREGLFAFFPRIPRTPAERLQAERRLRGMLHQPYVPETFFDRNRHPSGGAGRASFSASSFLHLFHCYPKDPKPGALPMVEQDDFTRNFGNEFFAIRRPSYYALIYAGAPMGEWQRVRVPQDPGGLYPRNGGGLSMFWSPSLGASILGKNWSTYAAHTLVATSANGRVDWEDYWSVRNSFAPDSLGTGEMKLQVSGKLRDQPLRYERSYVFHDDRIDVALTIHAEESCRLVAFEESLPFRIDQRAIMHAALVGDDGVALTPQVGMRRQARAVMLHHPGVREVHVVVFEEPRDILPMRQEDSRDAAKTWGRISIKLPSTWERGASQTFRSAYVVCHRNQLQEVLQQAIAWFADNPK
ncbi:MAG TPA: hypothetical protein PK098_06450 [Phycisphaerales bacterium]|nr:hypothetical protein [Phycisphaerales bacterium]